jgi:peptidoglycan/xylan/chitin deacetylase (PgdA/CDA1 family)
MDAGPGGYFSSSTLFKTSLLTIAFSTFYIYETKKRATIFKPVSVKADTAVTVKLAPVVAKKKKTIYLTFDDGPNKGTRKVMDIMDAEKIPATVFIIGEHVYGSKEQRTIFDSLITNKLFEIANHSYSHAFENKYRQFYDQPDSMVKDFARCADSLQLTTNIVRTPGRNVWRTSTVNSTDIKTTSAAADSLQRNGFKAIGWDLEWHFTNDQKLVQSDTLLLQQIDSLFAKNKTKMPNSLVLLAHDRTFLSPADSSALHRLIIALKKRDDYNFETVSQYPGLN